MATIFVVGCMEQLEINALGWLDTGCEEVSGIFSEFYMAHKAVMENWSDLQDHCYHYATVQEIETDTIYPDVVKEWWYRWDETELKWKQIETPSIIPKCAPYHVIH